MTALNDLIGSRELTVECRHCGWAGPRPLSWLSGQRDMYCPACVGVIVLNTSERRLEIAALHRQVSSLHDQLTDSITSAIGIMTQMPASLRPTEPKRHLALSIHQYCNNKWPSLNDASTPPRRPRSASRR
jgi:hypothetical protein